MLDALTADDFRRHVGATYQLTPTDGEPVPAELVEVTDHHVPDAPRAGFSLLFHAAAASAAQGTFRIEREGADALELFMVPVGPDEGGEGMRYEAVFG